MFVVMLWTRTTCQGQNKECFFGTETRIQCRDHNIEQLNTRAILQCCTGCRRKKWNTQLYFYGLINMLSQKETFLQVRRSKTPSL